MQQSQWEATHRAYTDQLRSTSKVALFDMDYSLRRANVKTDCNEREGSRSRGRKQSPVSPTKE